MKTKMKIFTISSLMFVFFAFPAFAQQAQNQTTNCFDYYKFGSVQVDVQSEITNAISGTPLALKGKIKNENTYPIVDGSVYIKVFKKQTDKELVQANGNLLVDQFVAKNNISLAGGEQQDIAFDWKIPSYATSGDYQIATFFISANKFNLLGLSFTDDVVGNTYDFKITGESKSSVEFDKNSVVINGEPYRFAAYPPRVEKGQTAVIKTTLVNSESTVQNIPVTWTAYFWDGQSKENTINTKTEVVSIDPNKSKEIEYVVTDSVQPVYFVVAEAQYKDTKSILDIRFVRNGVDRLRLNFPAVTSYPLKANEKATFFSCLHNAGSADKVDNGKLVLSLLDENKKQIAAYTYKGAVTGEMMAVKNDFIPTKTYDNFTLKADLYVENKLIDSVEMKYDCNLLGKGNCVSKDAKAETVSQSKGNIGMLIIACALLLIIIIFAVAIIKKRKTSASIFILGLIVGSGIFLSVNNAEAKSVTWNQSVTTLLYRCENQQGDNESICSNTKTNDWSEALENPNFSITYKAKVTNADTGTEINDGDSVSVGTKLKFTPISSENTDISWFGTGRFNDSPYGYWQASNPGSCKWQNKYDTKSGRYLYAAFAVNPSSVLVSHSGSSAELSCSDDGKECSVLSAGTVKTSFSFSQTSGEFYYSQAHTTDVDSKGNARDCEISNTPKLNYISSGKTFTFTQDIPSQTIAYSITAIDTNKKPNAPAIEGPKEGTTEYPYIFSIQGTDPDNDTLRYAIDWNNDGQISQYAPNGGFVQSGTSQQVSHSWITTGEKTFKVATVDESGLISDWTSHSIAIATPSSYFNFSATPLLITTGETAALSWATAGVSYCQASDGWNGQKEKTGGVELVSPVAKTSYTLECFDSKEISLGKQTVTVDVAPSSGAPLVSISAMPLNLSSEGSTTLSWTTLNASSCTASGGWSGSKAASGGSEVVSLSSTTLYSIECWNTSGVSSGKKTVEVSVSCTPTYDTYICSLVDTGNVCNPSTAGIEIVKKTAVCSRRLSNGCTAGETQPSKQDCIDNGVACPSDVLEKCPLATNGSWQEVAP